MENPYFSLKTTSSKKDFLLQVANYSFFQPEHKSNNQPRQLSIIGSDSYKRSLRRAFSRAKLLAFFNPDLTHFITLTYREEFNTPNQVIDDIKLLVKRQKRTALKNKKPQLKYIYVMELQKRGSIHVHMIANKALEYEINKNGYRSVKDWSHGFSSVLTIKDFDNNFRPYLYLFKYMAKAQRVGRSFIHISKNFDKIGSVDYADHIKNLSEGEIIHEENYLFKIEEKTYSINKNYIRKPRTTDSQKEA